MILIGQAITGSVVAITPDDMAVGAVSQGAMTTSVGAITPADMTIGLTWFGLTATLNPEFGILHYGNVDPGSNTSYTNVKGA